MYISKGGLLMLIQFNFKNFRSFRDESILDLSATKITEFSNRVVSIGNERVLPIATIYGANASGKTGVYEAFEYMSMYVVESFKFDDDEESGTPQRTPFSFDDSSLKADSSFEVYFTMASDIKERTYNYGFCIGEEGVTEEWLNAKAKTAKEYKTIFYRSNETLDLQGIPKRSRDNIRVALEKHTLIISLGAKLRIEKCKEIREWFWNNEFIDFGDEIASFIRSRNLPHDFASNKQVQNTIVNYFSSFDEYGIKGFTVEEHPDEENPKEIRYSISSKHKKVNSEKMGEIPLSRESAGTLKMFTLYPYLQDVLERGSVLFVDELNARLHPLLVRNFILLFLNPKINKNNAQLIFTTHDVWLLNSQLLRRDEIWFTEKDENGISHLYSLVDFSGDDGTKVRKDENYEKNYIFGKYGAIPTLRNLYTTEED